MDPTHHVPWNDYLFHAYRQSALGPAHSKKPEMEEKH